MSGLALLAEQTSSQSTGQAVGYPTLFQLVVLGSLVPVVPTGALVSSAAVVAFHQTAPFSLALVFVIASCAASAAPPPAPPRPTTPRRNTPATDRPRRGLPRAPAAPGPPSGAVRTCPRGGAGAE